jgi:hypothetical protein
LRDLRDLRDLQDLRDLRDLRDPFNNLRKATSEVGTAILAKPPLRFLLLDLLLRDLLRPPTAGLALSSPVAGKSAGFKVVIAPPLRTLRDLLLLLFLDFLCLLPPIKLNDIYILNKENNY